MNPNPLLIDPPVVLFFPDALPPAEGPAFHVSAPLSRGRSGPLPARPARNYTASRFLPFARLRLRTALPPFVAMRTRKPWVRFFFVLLKFVNVFFIVSTPVKLVSCP